MQQTNYPARRREFQQPLNAEIWNARVGVLSSVDEDGHPEARPLNFVEWQDALWFHSAPEGCLNRRAGQLCSFTCWQDAAWIPSYWRHPRQACPATTYYQSCVVRGQLASVTERTTKALVLEQFMLKYQPEGGYQRLQADDKLYAGPLDALAVLRLPLQDVSFKVKYGQHLAEAPRQRVFERLLERGDWRTAELVRRCNPSLPEPDGYSCDVTRMSAADIYGLLQHTYWAHKRSLQSVQRHRDQARAQWGYFKAGQLLAYARVEDWWLYDVVVHPDHRGQGIGTELVTRLLADPKLAGLPRLGLDTRDRCRFYERFGFQRVGQGPSGSWVMLRYP